MISGKPDPSIEKIDNYFASQIKPKNFYGRQSAELKYDKQFEKNAIALAQFANKPVKDCTTSEYFALIGHHNELLKEQRRKK